MLTITMSDNAIEERLRQIHFVQQTLRVFVMLFVAKHYPSVLKDRGFKESRDLFESDAGVFKFIQELAATPWEPA